MCNISLNLIKVSLELTQTQRPPNSVRSDLKLRLSLMLLALLFIVGCGSSTDVNVMYGRRRGGGARSVNGTAVLSEMFQQAGFRVSSWRRLSPKLQNDQVIVWVPDHFEAPPDDVVEYLESWLSTEPGRTLVYVARDYTAATDFWQQVMDTAPPEQKIEIRRKLAQIESDHIAAKNRAFAQDDKAMQCEWFSLEDDVRRELTGDALKGPWSDGIDSDRINIKLLTNVKLPTPEDQPSLDVRTLLESSQGVVAAELSRSYWRGSKIIVVANGSWLLNLPLVNAEHRVLASMLIDECGSPSRVCFLESGTAVCVSRKAIRTCR